MKDRSRYLFLPIRKEALEFDKMAFITGPRQVGKTTLAQNLAQSYPHYQYYNWDLEDFRSQWKNSPSSLIRDLAKDTCVVFDEIHKVSGWKRDLKGLYDVFRRQVRIIVTGSAQMETFRRGGDSLVGRYFRFQLHPYSVGELLENKRKGPKDLLDFLKDPQGRTSQQAIECMESLFEFGGFPEPYERASKRHWQMWRQTKLEKIFREDLRDLTRVTELGRLELLATLIPPRVGSLFSIKSLAEDMEVSQPTLKQWLRYLEAVFYQFTLRPFSKNLARALKKDSKMYLWDWSVLEDKGKRLENLVASALLKSVDYWNNLGYGEFSIHFFRDKEKHEVDFVITEKKEPWLLVEVKSSDRTVHPYLKYLAMRFPKAQAVQLIQSSNYYHRDLETKIHQMSLANFLEQLV